MDDAFDTLHRWRDLPCDLVVDDALLTHVPLFRAVLVVWQVRRNSDAVIVRTPSDQWVFARPSRAHLRLAFPATMDDGTRSQIAWAVDQATSGNRPQTSLALTGVSWWRVLFRQGPRRRLDV